MICSKNQWGKLADIKYIAAYQVTPISAVTHVAEIDTIEPYGDKGKYRVNFLSPAQEIDPVRYEVVTRPLRVLDTQITSDSSTQRISPSCLSNG